MSANPQNLEFRKDAKHGRRSPAYFNLWVTRNFIQGVIVFEWKNPAEPHAAATGTVRCTGRNDLSWQLQEAANTETLHSTHEPEAIRLVLDQWLGRFPARRETFS